MEGRIARGGEIVLGWMIDGGRGNVLCVCTEKNLKIGGDE